MLQMKKIKIKRWSKWCIEFKWIKTAVFVVSIQWYYLQSVQLLFALFYVMENTRGIAHMSLGLYWAIMQENGQLQNNRMENEYYDITRRSFVTFITRLGW